MNDDENHRADSKGNSFMDKEWNSAIGWLSSCYIISAFALSGIPGLSRLALVFALAAWMVIGVNHIKGRTHMPQWLIFPIYFLFYVLLISFTGDVFRFNNLGMVVSTWLGALAVGVAVSNSGQWRHVFLGFLIAALANFVATYLGFNSYLEYSGGVDEFYYAEVSGTIDRASGLTGNANVLAIQATLPVLFLYLFSKKEIPRGLRIVCYLLGVAAVSASGSRKGLLLLIAASLWIFAIPAFSSSRYRSIYVTTLMTLGLILLLLSIYIPDFVASTPGEYQALERILLALDGRDSSFDERSHLVNLAIPLFFDAPVFGYGLDMFRFVSGTGLFAHNNYAEMAVDGGFIMMALYYSMHIYIWIHAKMLPLVDRIGIRVMLVTIFVNDYWMVSYDSRAVPLILVCMMVFVNREKYSNNEFYKN